MKKVAGTLKLDLSQYDELKAFTQFGSELDKTTKELLARGERIMEILKQDQYEPMPVAKQVAIVYAANNGYLDNLKLADINRYEQEMLKYIEDLYPQIYSSINETKDLTEETEELLKKALVEFGKEFIPSSR